MLKNISSKILFSLYVYVHANFTMYIGLCLLHFLAIVHMTCTINEKPKQSTKTLYCIIEYHNYNHYDNK